jgi:hypothetical protein
LDPARAGGSCAPLARSGYPEPARLTLRRVFGGAEVVTGVDALAFVSGGAPDLGQGEQTEVAIAVNGRVAAIGATFDLDDGQAFAVMLPASAFRPGANDVRAYEVAPDGASLARPGG